VEVVSLRALSSLVASISRPRLTFFSTRFLSCLLSSAPTKHSTRLENFSATPSLSPTISPKPSSNTQLSPAPEPSPPKLPPSSRTSRSSPIHPLPPQTPSLDPSTRLYHPSLRPIDRSRLASATSSPERRTKPGRLIGWRRSTRSWWRGWRSLRL